MKTKVIFALRDFEGAAEEAARLLREGGIAALPTETVYGLCADAGNENAVRKVFEAKGRPQDNPLIVHIADYAMLGRVAACVPDAAMTLMKAFWPGPLSVVLKKNPALPDIVTSGLSTVAVRMPENEIMREVIARADVPVAAPSANRSGRPSPTTARHVFEDMAGRVPLIVDGGPCAVGVESTVVDMTGGVPVILRPGGITPEQIKTIAGEAAVHSAVPGGAGQAEKPASPGMKYRHYAPRARVAAFEGDKKTVAKRIRTMYDLYSEKSLKAVIICPDDCARFYAGRRARALGPGAAAAERALFSELRLADDEGADAILFHYTDEMGLAVKDRIFRAAEQYDG